MLYPAPTYIFGEYADGFYMKKDSSLSLLTDLYQLTMAYGYWKQGLQQHEAVFHLFFRKAPFNGSYAVACGLQTVVDYLQRFRFEREDLIYLSQLTGNEGSPLFEPAFLDYLYKLDFSCTVHGVPEGSIVFAHEPILRIQGPLIQCQLIESALLNMVNFQTLIATKASRVCMAAGDDEVLDFGLRRAQGIDGALTASRAAYIGGCVGTSNLLAGKQYGIPVRGTHAHSWVMTFENELEAFLAYAQSLPHNCGFLVDTYNTLTGVKHAIRIGQMLRDSNFEMIGIRLDSGDLALLSQQARALLDEAGFEDAVIVASNDLDEYRIHELKKKGALINVWGVGTRLVTAFDQPALGGVYKMAALRAPEKSWEMKIKLSEDPIKVSNPGILQVRRFSDNGQWIGDMIYNELWEEQGNEETFESFEGKKIAIKDKESANLLHTIFDRGKLVYLMRDIKQKRAHAIRQRSLLPDNVRSLTNPDAYPVGLEARLQEYKTGLIEKHRNVQS